jgi:(S)-2-hydroxy-acid oxidase
MREKNRRQRRALLGGLASLPGYLALARAGLPSVASAAPKLTGSEASRVVNVADFEALARARLPPGHFGYIATGVDDDRTVVWNHEAYSHIQIRSRRFADVGQIDTARAIFGSAWKQPFYFSAVSGMGAFHPDGELAVARAAASRDVPFMLSTLASRAVEQVTAAVKRPPWFQLYPTDDWSVTEAVVRRAERAGCEVIVLTVDVFRDRNTETLKRAARSDKRDCTQCHGENFDEPKPVMYEGIDLSKVKDDVFLNFSVAQLRRLRKLVSGKLLIKGIVTAEDAKLALSCGADGLIVSNHGGRGAETLRSTIECLPEIVAAVGKRLPILIDGGIRRGTDVFKALAFGATAVGLGRPQTWGLAAYGQEGVEAVTDILSRELCAIMRAVGTPDLASITKDRVAWSRY